MTNEEPIKLSKLLKFLNLGLLKSDEANIFWKAGSLGLFLSLNQLNTYVKFSIQSKFKCDLILFWLDTCDIEYVPE